MYNKVHVKNYEQRMHENGSGDIYGYDPVYRLTNAKFNVPDPTAANPTQFEKEKSIHLDHVDNITRIDEIKNGVTRQITTEIPPDTDFSKLNQYSRFDQWGLTYDKNGNLMQKGMQKMYYDFRNQMVKVTEGTTTTESKYDAFGRRLKKIVTTDTGSQTENYYYAGHQIVEVRDGSDNVLKQYIYGNGIDEVLRMDNYNGSTIIPYYFHSNGIGSTTAVTDANGNVIERYRYGLYGMPTFLDAAGNEIPGSSIGNNILFQGREYEPETNLYYFRARHLDPIMGRFLSVDPLGYRDSLNLYQAFNMNPVNFVDPFGERLIFDKRYFDDKQKYEEFKAQVLEMIKYLFFGSKTARKYLIALIEDQNFDINILYMKEEMLFLRSAFVYKFSTRKDVIKDVNEKEHEWHGIFIDPLSGLRLEKKIYDKISGSLRDTITLDFVQSPALGFIHELIHAYIHNMNPKEEDFLQSLLIKGYENFLEKKVIQEETKITSELGEPARFQHAGKEYTVESPTSFCLSLKHNLWFTDSMKKDYDQDLAKLFERIIKLILEIGEVKKDK
jgi:RHS repeat-associated protein